MAIYAPVRQAKGSVRDPLRFSTDWSMAIINAVLKAVNFKTIQDYLTRSWEVVNGRVEDDKLFWKCVLHVCSTQTLIEFRQHTGETRATFEDILRGRNHLNLLAELCDIEGKTGNQKSYEEHL